MNGAVLLAAVLTVLALERGVEVVVNRRHVAWLKAHDARFQGEDGFSLILLVQVLLFALAPLEFIVAPWAGTGAWTWPCIGAAVLAQGLRYWVIRTLGPRWCIRVVTLPGASRITGGPYRFLRHPNYVAVAAEVVVIPLAFGAVLTAVVLSALNAAALARRIRFEDAALSTAEATAPKAL